MAINNGIKRTPTSVQSHSSNLRTLDPSVEVLLDNLAATFDALREQCELPPAESLEFVVAEDLAAAVRDLSGQTIGVEDLNGYRLERFGGTVVGKTMFLDDAHRCIVIVLDADILWAEDQIARAVEVYLVSHELAHGLLGQLRSAARSAMDPTYLPWETSRWFARYAFEEYLADSLAEAVLRQHGHVTDDDGTEHPLSMKLIFPRNAAFIDAVLSQLRETVDRIHQYRLDAQLEDMWRDVQEATSQMLITMAHAQAEVDDPAKQPSTALSSERALEFGPLHDCWEAVHQLFASHPVLCPPERFATLEPQLLDKAGDLILDLWAELGLTFEQEGDSFHITVATPNDAWRPEATN